MATAKRFVRRVRTRPKNPKKVAPQKPKLVEPEEASGAEEVWSHSVGALESLLVNCRAAQVSSMLKAERRNPNFPGGRKGAIEILKLRLLELSG